MSNCIYLERNWHLLVWWISSKCFLYILWQLYSLGTDFFAKNMKPRNILIYYFLAKKGCILCGIYLEAPEYPKLTYYYSKTYNIASSLLNLVGVDCRHAGWGCGDRKDLQKCEKEAVLQEIKLDMGFFTSQSSKIYRTIWASSKSQDSSEVR